MMWINGEWYELDEPHTHSDAPSSNEACRACIAETFRIRTGV